ncbi:hypothetical protein AB205_0067790 [Aquarana catesbeiana]|uniref:BTB domain-containing protein n=1 Tax=Aquarana catesbeiana TaxID=8400 RepID=A0A2G9QG18_AQUCT|nr:hypothetical protein AB205_0067790 [Aquarana catesbeiana]
MDAVCTIGSVGSRRSVDKHAQIVLQQMNKMRQHREFCDLQIRVGPVLFPVHKLVLAASSPYFAALLSGGLKESSDDVVLIQEVEPNSFQLLLDFIYSGSVDISTENVQGLMVAADMMQLNDLVALCCDFLKEQIEPANCVGFFQFSEQLACQPLLEFTESYIHAHFPEVKQGDEFLNLTKDQLTRLLRSEELCIEDEHQVFASAMAWLQRDTATRKRHVVEVLEPVRFPLLPPQRLQKDIEDVTDFSLRVALQTLLREYCESSQSPKDRKLCNFLQPSRVWPRRKARKFLYAIGGWVGVEIGNSIERFSPEENSWQVVGRMSVSRYYFACCERQGLIYVVGGMSQEGLELSAVEVYDPISRRWTSLPPMATRRAYLGVACLNDCLYVVGGWNEAQDALNTVERYSFEEVFNLCSVQSSEKG